MPERGELWTRNLTNTVTLMPDHYITLPLAAESDRPYIEYRNIALPPFDSLPIRAFRTIFTRTVLGELSRAAKPVFGENPDLQSRQEEFIRFLGLTLSKSTETQDMLTGLVNFYSDINHISRPAGVILKPTESFNTPKLAAFYVPDHSLGSRPTDPDYRKIIIDSTYSVTEFDGNADCLVEISLHEWIHHLIAVYGEDYDMFDVSFYIDDDHSQNYLRLAKKLGINTELERN